MSFRILKYAATTHLDRNVYIERKDRENQEEKTVITIDLTREDYLNTKELATEVLIDFESQGLADCFTYLFWFPQQLRRFQTQ